MQSGNITSLILFLSPLPTFIQIWKKGSVEQFSPAPYLATLLNCMIWLVYGLPLVHPHSMLLITINGSGCLIELTFVLLFLFYSDGRKRFRVLVMLMLEFAFVASVAILVLTLSHTISRRSLVVGSVCVFFGTLMYAAPLAVLKLVITTRSIEYMPFFLSLASFVNSICWTAYAVIRFDLFITIPNSLGILFGLVQLILYGKFYKSTQRQIEARKRQGKGDMGLPEVVLIQDSKKMIINNPTQQNGYLVSETPGQP
ncbi:bidirectional sugar transporter SWEET4-like isoform X3 [Macadamia integrifolia]|uniref:bidirectional sugar transporter SWEET4-like isoform X3 n=1 Tax=Macadamia integrifolia TaxID=60698 RepID=UPI001C4F3050|nr:bidirectional sugar transporter SWEET4-like isoform X3 [Macadamia integrifolia]